MIRIHDKVTYLRENRSKQLDSNTLTNRAVKASIKNASAKLRKIQSGPQNIVVTFSGRVRTSRFDLSLNVSGTEDEDLIQRIHSCLK